MGVCLANNNVTDVSALDAWQWLDLSANAITDVSALGSLASLSWLSLSGNAIRDVAELGNLSLAEVYLDNNQISDVSAFGRSWRLGGTRLMGLYAENNQIADVSALVGSFTTDQLLALRGNPLSADSAEALRTDGAAVLAGRQVPLFPSAADPSGREGLVRVLNRSDVAGVVLIEAVDDAGVRSEPVRLAIGAGGAAHFNSADLESGNAMKGLPTGVGVPTTGSWRLELYSALDIEALAYIRTPDGFLTSIHDVVPRYQRACWEARRLPSDRRSAIFNPASNSTRRSILRLINAGRYRLHLPIWGIDDVGTVRGFAFDVRAGAATATADQLQGLGLDAGVGKWRLVIDAPRQVAAMSLLESPDGYLTNLSTAPLPDADGIWRVPFFPTSSDASVQGFVRVANLGNVSAEAAIVAVDDGGMHTRPVVLELGPRQTVHFNSRDLEQGNDVKGLPRGVGSPTQGDWRLAISTESDIRVTSFVRGPRGFLAKPTPRRLMTLWLEQADCRTIVLPRVYEELTASSFLDGLCARLASGVNMPDTAQRLLNAHDIDENLEQLLRDAHTLASKSIALAVERRRADQRRRAAP